MKLTINRLALLKVLNTVSVAIEQKSPTPAFLNFKLDMKEDNLEITGSNNDLTIKSSLPVQTEDNIIISDYTCGSTLISAKYLLDIVRKLDSDTLTIEVIDEVIARISDEKSKFHLHSMRSEEYPDLDLSISGKKVMFPSDDFKRIINQVAFAASTKEVRPILTAVNIKAFKDRLEFVATDSYRLSKKIYELSNKDEFEANIPVNSLVIVSKLIEDEDINLNISNNKVVFEFGNTTVYSRLISGDFPKTSRMIPDHYPFVLRVKSSSFIDAMDRVSLLSTEKERIVKLELDADYVEISSKSEQIGSARESVDMFEYSGDRFSISFNEDYVSDAIKACMSEDVIISFAGEMNAFKVSASDDESIVQIITPVRSYY